MIIRTHKDRNFTIFSNSVLQNSTLSWEARGLLVYLISLPENWETHVTELSNRSPAGYSKNKRILAELEAAGHIVRSQKRGENGRFKDWIFDIYDEPRGVTDGAVLPHSGKPNPVDPVPEKHQLERTQKEKKKTAKKEPVAEGDGENRDACAERARLSFKNEFGFFWSPAHARLLDENRACAIFRREKITDAALARRIVAEWAAEAARGFHSDDPVGALVWLCRRAADPNAQPLAVSREGENLAPSWT